MLWYDINVSGCTLSTGFLPFFHYLLIKIILHIYFEDVLFSVSKCTHIHVPSFCNLPNIFRYPDSQTYTTADLVDLHLLIWHAPSPFECTSPVKINTYIKLCYIIDTYTFVNKRGPALICLFQKTEDLDIDAKIFSSILDQAWLIAALRHIILWSLLPRAAWFMN